MAADRPISLPPMTGRRHASWTALVELAPSFGDHWLLIGGQMVLLHEVERHARDVRPTDDVDVAIDLRTEPAGLARIHDALRAAGFDQDQPGPDGIAHRYRRGQAVIDVLAPDNIGRRARLDIGVGRTIEAPGTSQAFRRSATVTVRLDDTIAQIRRPSLLAGFLGKIAAATKITSQTTAERLKHLQDADALAKLLGPDDRKGAELSPTDRKLIAGFLATPGISPLAATQARILGETPPN